MPGPINSSKFNGLLVTIRDNIEPSGVRKDRDYYFYSVLNFFSRLLKLPESDYPQKIDAEEETLFSTIGHAVQQTKLETKYYRHGTDQEIKPALQTEPFDVNDESGNTHHYYLLEYDNKIHVRETFVGQNRADETIRIYENLTFKKIRYKLTEQEYENKFARIFDFAKQNLPEAAKSSSDFYEALFELVDNGANFLQSHFLQYQQVLNQDDETLLNRISALVNKEMESIHSEKSRTHCRLETKDPAISEHEHEDDEYRVFLSNRNNPSKTKTYYRPKTEELAINDSEHDEFNVFLREDNGGIQVIKLIEKNPPSFIISNQQYFSKKGYTVIGNALFIPVDQKSIHREIRFLPETVAKEEEILYFEPNLTFVDLAALGEKRSVKPIDRDKTATPLLIE